jgi:iron uptake system component EfeO
MSETPNKSSPAMRAAVAGSALLVVAGLATFWWAAGVARKAPPKAVDHAVTVTIQGNVCEPNDITVPAGRTTFTIVNQSQRALEWEILDGVRVVEERENIAPGFSQTMTAKLLPGDYAITCGLLSNPRGRLHVTPTAESDAEAARPSQVAYVGALAEYRVFLALAGGDLQDATQALADAITSGDLQQARALYVPAHQAYKRVEPMAELFADLDQRLNARADYFEKREADPAFTGFHRIRPVRARPGRCEGTGARGRSTGGRRRPAQGAAARARHPARAPGQRRIEAAAPRGRQPAGGWRRPPWPRRGGQPAGHAGRHEEAGRPAVAAAGQGGA